MIDHRNKFWSFSDVSDSAKGSLQLSAKTAVPQCSKVWRQKITIDIVGSIYDDDDGDDDDEGMIIMKRSFQTRV